MNTSRVLLFAVVGALSFGTLTAAPDNPKKSWIGVAYDTVKDHPVILTVGLTGLYYVGHCSKAAAAKIDKNDPEYNKKWVKGTLAEMKEHGWCMGGYVMSKFGLGDVPAHEHTAPAAAVIPAPVAINPDATSTEVQKVAEIVAAKQEAANK